VGAGRILDNGVQPRGELGATLKLAEIAKGQEEPFLKSILGIFGIAKHLPGDSPQARHA
jgi:hypothetical protein